MVYLYLFVFYSLMLPLWLACCKQNQKLMVLHPHLHWPQILVLLFSLVLPLLELFFLLPRLHNLHTQHLKPSVLFQYLFQLLLRLSFLNLIFLFLNLILLLQLNSSSFSSIHQLLSQYSQHQ